VRFSFARIARRTETASYAGFVRMAAEQMAAGRMAAGQAAKRRAR
jgi:hypothetical protein